MNIDSIIKDWGLYIIIGEAAIIVLVLLWHSLYSDNGSEEIESLEQDKYDLEKKLKTKENELNKYKKAYNESQEYLDRWNVFYEQNKHLLVRDETKPPLENPDLSGEKGEKSSESEHSYQYLQEANNGKFMKLHPVSYRCYFRTWEEGDVRRYEFYGNANKALANINAIFDDVCDIEGKRNGASVIENVCPGTLDSDLRIINKAKIRLNHNSAAKLRNRYAEGLELGLVFARGLGFFPFVIQSYYPLAA